MAALRAAHRAALHGLVLAGGASTRMQRDKAALAYHGVPQLQWSFDLLSHLCAATFVSVRADQREEPARAGFPQIVDGPRGAGPAAGIAAALLEHPGAAWLVVACDLPFLDESTLRHLVRHRDPHRIATAYRSSHDALPEPLCAIWEPAAREPLLAYLDGGRRCPRKFLIESDVLLLELPHARALDNVNTQEEFSEASAALRAPHPHPVREPGNATGGAGHSACDAPALHGRGQGGDSPAGSRTLRVQYYAILREQAGRSEETLDTSAATPAQLYAELRRRHPFRLAPAQLKVALNSQFSDWQAPLKHGDTVVFIPPVAGG